GSVIVFKLSPNLRSSLKAQETLEKPLFIASEIDKMEKILSASTIKSTSVKDERT
ncbi:hypothetical protein CDAR_562981, partial [Caerostris darwini]